MLSTSLQCQERLLICFVFLFDSLAIGKKQAIISEEASEMETAGDSKEESRLATCKKAVQQRECHKYETN